MFSGRHPSETGVVLSRIPIPEDVPLLAEWLSEAGYETLGFAGPPLMDPKFGYGRGFDRYFEPYDEFFPKSPEYLKTALSDSLLTGPMLRAFWSYLTAGYDKHTELKLDITRKYLSRTDGPTFVMANLFTPHLPYDPPRPYKTEATSELDCPRWDVLERLGFEEEMDDEEIRDDRIFDHSNAESISKYVADPSYYNEAELEALKSWYRAGARYTGDRIEEFVQYLEAAGELENTILIVTSDHGDFIGEHGLFGHAQYLHEEVTRVPLIVAGPDVPADETRSRLASHVDIFDTVCDLAGIEPPADTSGLSLFGDDEHDAVFSEHGTYLEARRNRSGVTTALSEEQARVLTAGRKTVRTAEHRYELVSDGTEHLYARPSDEPFEESGTAEDLRDTLVDVLGDEFRSRDGAAKSVDEDVQSTLRQLGYFE